MVDNAVPTLMCVKISGSEKAIRAFLSSHPMQVESTTRERDLVVLETFIPQSLADSIKDPALKVEVLYDATARGRERHKEVGQGNRFKGEQKIPKGLGVKTGGPKP